MREDVRQLHLGAVGVLGVRRTARGQRGRALGGDARDLVAPAEHLADRLDHRLGRLDGRVVAHHRNAPGVLVEATGVGALDVLVQAAVTALVDVAVLVHHRVVADVAPAQRLRVVLVHAADDARRLRLRVIVRARRVVDGGRLDGIVVGGVAAACALVGAPARAGDHARHAGQVLRVDDRVDRVALGGVAVDEHRVDRVERHLVVDGLDVAPGGEVVDGAAVGARGLLDVAGTGPGRACPADLLGLAQAAGTAGHAGAPGGTGAANGVVLLLGAARATDGVTDGVADRVAGIARAAAGTAGAEEVLEAAALVIVELGRTLDVVDGHAGTRAEHVEAVGGHLHGGGRLDVDELGAVDAVALAVGRVMRLGAVPLRPGAVRAQRTEVAGDVGRTLPGQREHGELLVAAEFLDHAAIRVQLVGHGLRGDGGVLHQHGRTGGEGHLVDERVDRPAAVVLDELDGRAAAECDERRGDERGHHSEDEWASRAGVGADASSVQQGSDSKARVQVVRRAHRRHPIPQVMRISGTGDP